MHIISVLPEIAVTAIVICLMPESDLSYIYFISVHVDCPLPHIARNEKLNFGTWNVRTDPSEYVVCSALDQYGIDLAVLLETKDSKVCNELLQQVGKDGYQVFYSGAPEDGRNHHGV